MHRASLKRFCLNSQPLYPISSDLKDLDPLTPGHFLIGSPITDLIYPVTDVKVACLGFRYQIDEDISMTICTNSK